MLPSDHRQSLETALARRGLKATRQREAVYAVLLDRPDHPTADEVCARARAEAPGISLATVYNCLETLVECGLIKRLSYERQPGRYCPNHGEHAHFLDEESGRVFDIDLPRAFARTLTRILPRGFEARQIRLSFSGRATPVAAARRRVRRARPAPSPGPSDGVPSPQPLSQPLS